MAKKIACIGDSSNHGGVITTSNQDGSFLVAGLEVAVEGALHACPVHDHGVTAIVAVATKSLCNGKLIITENAVAGCGAVIQPSDRGVYIE